MMLTLALFGCETSEVENPNENVQLEKIENVKQLTGSQQRVAFRLLNDESKVYLWQEKLDYLLGNLTNENQLEAIEELKKIVSPKIYFKNSNTNLLIEEWVIINKKHFTKQEYIDNFVSLGRVAIQQYSDTPDCGCNKSEDYCHFGDTCQGEDCTTENNWIGCGTLWASDCNGVCG